MDLVVVYMLWKDVVAHDGVFVGAFSTVDLAKAHVAKEAPEERWHGCVVREGRRVWASHRSSSLHLGHYEVREVAVDAMVG